MVWEIKRAFAKCEGSFGVNFGFGSLSVNDSLESATL